MKKGIVFTFALVMLTARAEAPAQIVRTDKPADVTELQKTAKDILEETFVLMLKDVYGLDIPRKSSKEVTRFIKMVSIMAAALKSSSDQEALIKKFCISYLTVLFEEPKEVAK